MSIEREARKISKGLAIPTSRLRFDSYRDQRRQVDIMQVYFRERNPPQEKYAFEVPVTGGDLSDSERLRLRRMLTAMEESYLESGPSSITFYRGQAFFYQELATAEEGDDYHIESDISMPAAGAYTQIECTSCGWELESPPIKMQNFLESRDLILMWLLARGKGRCGCSQFDPIEGRADRQLDIGLDELNVEEGSLIPRVT